MEGTDEGVTYEIVVRAADRAGIAASATANSYDGESGAAQAHHASNVAQDDVQGLKSGNSTWTVGL